MTLAARTMLPRLIAVAEAAKGLRIDVLADGADVSALVAALAALEAP